VTAVTVLITVIRPARDVRLAVVSMDLRQRRVCRDRSNLRNAYALRAAAYCSRGTQPKRLMAICHVFFLLLLICLAACQVGPQCLFVSIRHCHSQFTSCTFLIESSELSSLRRRRWALMPLNCLRTVLARGCDAATGYYALVSFVCPH
jgi:hypothetical protein